MQDYMRQEYKNLKAAVQQPFLDKIQYLQQQLDEAHVPVQSFQKFEEAEFQRMKEDNQELTTTA